MMTSENSHFDDELQELIDGRLDESLRKRVELHLESCKSCSLAVDALRWTKTVSPQQTSAVAIPADLNEMILSALKFEDNIRRVESAPRRIKPFKHLILAFGLAVCLGIALALVSLVVRQSSDQRQEIVHVPEPVSPTPVAIPELPLKVSRDFRDYYTGNIPLQLKTSSVRKMEAFFASEKLAFDGRVFDLSMMKFDLVGGRVHNLNDSLSAFYVYRGPNNETLVCQMYLGNVADLPRSEDVRINDGIRFSIYKIDGVTAIFWQEGDVACVLTSNINSEDLIALAFAKAVKV